MNERLAGVVVALDKGELDDLIPTIEILVQEGLVNFAIHSENPDTETLIGIYGSRARLGVHRVATADEAASAIALGATFVLPDLWDDDLTEACAPVATYPPAMTPTEIRRVLALPVAGAQVTPGDVLGPSFAELMGQLGMAERCLPRHSLGAFVMGKWFDAGARAVVAESQLVGDALKGGDLGSLRDRCRAFVEVQKKAPKA